MIRLLTLLAAVVVTGIAVLLGGRILDDPGAGPGVTPEPRPTAEPTADPTSEESPSVRPTRAAAAPRPREGSCYRLSFDQAVAPTASGRPVGCGEEHTAVTFRVGTLDTVVGGHLVAVDSARVRDQVARRCPDLFSQTVGGTLEQRRLSLLRPVWFTPTVEQSDTGADWFRCDAVALARDGTLAPVGDSVSGVLATQAGRDRYGLCATAEPGTADFQRVICAGDHAWRAVRTVPFSGADYPGATAVRSAGTQPCRSAGRAASTDQLDFEWGYEWPTAQQWDAGQTYGICWIPR